MGESSDERAFRDAVAGVQPLARPRPPSRHGALAGTPPPPVPAQTRRSEREALRESLEGPLSVDAALESGEEPVYLRDGIPRQVLRRMRRGHWVVQASVDLHGLNRSEAAAAAGEFLRACAARGLRCVRIVHGKGLGSRNGVPVLKQAMVKVLPRRDDVLAFCQAPAAHGGSGALLVLLKARR